LAAALTRKNAPVSWSGADGNQSRLKEDHPDDVPKPRLSHRYGLTKRNETMNTINLETLLPWSAPVRVQTKIGPRVLRKAHPNEEFSELWNNGAKETLKAAGIGWSKETDGTWLVCWWGQVPAEETTKTQATIAASRAADADVTIPAPPGCTYLGYQKAGIQFALERPGTLIADEMGLGKTIQGIGVINADPKIARVLVICPASLKLNWYRELKKWLVRPLSVGIADSKVFPTTDIVILNYDIAHKYERALSFYWDLIRMALR
jgi:hypothetical protein